MLRGPHLWRGIDEQASMDTIYSLFQQANDEVRGLTDYYPDYPIQVATRPYLHDYIIDGVERRLDDLNMVGFDIFIYYEGRPNEFEALHPIY